MTGRQFHVVACLTAILIGVITGAVLASRHEATFSAVTSVEILPDRSVLAPLELGPPSSANDATAYLSGEVAYLTSDAQQAKVADTCEGREVDLEASQVGASNVVTIQAKATQAGVAEAVLGCAVKVYEKERQDSLRRYIATETTSAQTRLTQLGKLTGAGVEQESVRLQERVSELAAMESRVEAVVQERSAPTAAPRSGPSPMWLWPFMGGALGLIGYVGVRFVRDLWRQWTRPDTAVTVVPDEQK